MSQFLGPIHYLMWDRIKLVNDRDVFVERYLTDELGEEVAEAVAKARREHGFTWDDRPLEEQVEGESIHPFLQDKVDRVETSEAALVGEIDREVGERGRQALERAYYRHGEEFGSGLIAESGVVIDDLEGVQEILDTYVLEGMPCDGGATSRIDERGNLVYSRPLGLHTYYWEKAVADPRLMVDLIGKWIEGLVHGVNSEFVFERSVSGTMVEDRIGTGEAKGKEECGGGDDFERRVTEALDQIRPMLAMDGGGIELVSADAEKKTVAVRLMGACHGCAGAQMTLQYGVERALREKIPELESMEVV